MLDQVGELKCSKSVLDFNVSRHDLFYKDDGEHVGSIAVPNYKALRRDDTGDTLAVVRDTYTVVQNGELFDQVMHEIEDSIGQSVGRHVAGDSIAYKGGICLRDVRFPDFKFDIGQGSVALRAIIMNSFGRGAIKIYFGAIDFFCTNGIIRGSYDHVYKKHTSGLTIDGVGRTMQRGLRTFEGDTQRWRQWVGTSITRSTAEETLKELGISRLLVLRLMAQFDHEVKTRGSTLWALYSALTHYSSHNTGDFTIRKTDNDHEAMTMLHREEDVMRWTNHDAWKKIAA